jgi:hypothetical protein
VQRTHFGQHPPSCFGCHVQTLHIRNRSAFQPHFNYSVGGYVDTPLAFNDALKRRAEENTIATGTEHNYEMRDPAELATTVPFPDHDDILNDQGRAIHDKFASDL